MNINLSQKTDYFASNRVFVFLIQLTILFITVSGLDIFLNPSHSNRTGIPTFLRYNNLSLLLILFASFWIVLRHGIPKFRITHLLVLVYCSTFLFSFFQTNNLLNITKNLMLYGRGILIYLLFQLVMASNENTKKIINSILWMGILCVPFALMQEFRYLESVKIPYPDSIVTNFHGISFLRVQAFMSECNFLAFCLGFSFLLLIGKVNKFNQKHWINNLLILLMGLVIIFTFSRAVLLALIITLCLDMRNQSVPIFRNKKVDQIISYGALIFIFFVFYIRNDYSNHSRLILLKESIDMILKNPVLGTGVGNAALHTSEKIGPHNQFLDVAASCGIFSLLVYILFLYWIYRELKEIIQINPPLGQTLKNCFIYMLIVFMFEGLTSNIVPWIIFGLIDLAYRTIKTEERKSLLGSNGIQPTN